MPSGDRVVAWRVCYVYREFFYAKSVKMKIEAFYVSGEQKPIPRRSKEKDDVHVHGVPRVYLSTSVICNAECGLARRVPETWRDSSTASFGIPPPSPYTPLPHR